MYQAPNIQVPSSGELRKISDSLNLGVGDEDIASYHSVISGMLKTSYSVLEKYIEPSLPVKYPRTPGKRPAPEDNQYNAWYYKSEIAGTPDGPLKGYKVAIKDSFPVAGVPMMHGSRVMEGYVPDYDPTAVTRILDAGATITGKATCEDFCFSVCSCTSHPSPVLNPRDVTRDAGGSSSGCAVLIQTGEVDLALGGDQGGSIRVPASWTGIVGLKPTYGLVPYTGLGSLSPAVDSCGPMARTVRDCALMLQVIAGDDGGLDMRQRRVPDPGDIPKYAELLTGDVSGQKIGLLVEGFEGCDDDVATVVRRTAESLRAKGATVGDVSVPIHKDVEALGVPTDVEGSFHSMINTQGYCVGPPSYYPTSAIDTYQACMKAHSRDMSPLVKNVQLLGKYISDNYGMHFYAKSQNLLRYARERYDEILSTYDVIIMPTARKKAPKLPPADVKLQDTLTDPINMMGNTIPFNLTGHPAISLNAGYSEGLPVGMMIVGRHMDEQKLLNVAYAYEQIQLEQCVSR